MLTKSKVLSNTGLDISGGKVLVSNNINLNTNQTNLPVKNPPRQSPEIKDFKTREVEGITIVPASTDANPYENLDTQPQQDVSYSEKPSELDLLKKILRLYLSNILRIEGKLVLKNDDLIDLVKFITNASDVKIEVDFEVNCCGTSKGLNMIKKILIITPKQVVDMKYCFNEEYNTLLTYGISLDFSID